MKRGDFYDSEQSHLITLSQPTAAGEFVVIEHTGSEGKKTILKDRIAVQEGEILDASFMSVRALRSFFEEEIQVTPPPPFFLLRCWCRCPPLHNIGPLVIDA